MYRFLCSFCSWIVLTRGYLLLKSLSIKQLFPSKTIKWTRHRQHDYNQVSVSQDRTSGLLCYSPSSPRYFVSNKTSHASETAEKHKESYPQSLKSVFHTLVSCCSGVSSLEKIAACCRPLHRSSGVVVGWGWCTGGGRLTEAAVSGSVRETGLGLQYVCGLAHSPADWRRWGVSQGSSGGISIYPSVEPITINGQVQGAGCACQSADPNTTGVWIVIVTHCRSTSSCFALLVLESFLH